MSNEIYSIHDLIGYARSVRESAAKSFSEDYSENLDDFISIQQTISIIKSYSLGMDDTGKVMINEELFNEAFSSLREWLYGVGLAKLASKGYVECAWDSDKNEMVFWLPDKKQTHLSNKPS